MPRFLTKRFPNAEKVMLLDRCQAEIYDQTHGFVQCKLHAKEGTEWCWIHSQPERHPEKA